MKTQIRLTSRYCEQRISQLCISVGCYADPWERWSGTRSISEGLRGLLSSLEVGSWSVGSVFSEGERLCSSQPTWMAWLFALVALRLSCLTENQASSSLPHDPVRLSGLIPGESQFPGVPEKTRGLLWFQTSAVALQAPRGRRPAHTSLASCRLCQHWARSLSLPFWNLVSLVIALREGTAQLTCVYSNWSLGSNVDQWNTEVIKPHYIPTEILFFFFEFWKSLITSGFKTFQASCFRQV